eukprot:GEMP01048758.1.p1 GENE.GEMP01048758.1~~GEMP01048758.1.p1  ORF type:complete len:367 (+),score=77.45 GEMP01048758.1:61-1161(+)
MAPSSSSSSPITLSENALHGSLFAPTCWIFPAARAFVRVCVVQTICCPLERARILLQTQEANARILNREVLKYEGIRDCFRRIRREEGILSLWRGNAAACLAVLPLYLLSRYDVLPRLFHLLRLPQSRNGCGWCWRGLVAVLVQTLIHRAVTSAVTLPFRYCHLRMAADIRGKNGQRDFEGARDCLSRTFLSHKSTFGFCKSTLWMPNQTYLNYWADHDVARFGVPQAMQSMDPYPRGSEEWRYAWLMTTAAIEGCLLASVRCVSYPLQSLRMRLELQAEKDVHHEEIAYHGTMDCIAKIVQDERLGGFFRGVGAHVMCTILARVIGCAFDQLEGPAVAIVKRNMIDRLEGSARWPFLERSNILNG